MLAVGDGKPKSVTDVKRIAVEVGFREILKWNVADILMKTKGLAIRLPDGWEISAAGYARLQGIGIGQMPAQIARVSAELRAHVSSIQKTETRAFLEEAVSCFENGSFRAAVIMSWVGAVSILYDHVIGKKLPEFNTEAKRRDAKWRQAVSADDLAIMKEADFLNILVSISVIGKNVKQQLENCLTLRNGCGHPNSLKIAENTVAAHLEILILNVYSKF